jgi:hypothetical protein
VTRRVTDWSKPSGLRTATLLMAVVVVGAGLRMAGLPIVAAGIFMSWITVAIVMHHMAVARSAGATAMATAVTHRPLEQYPVRLPADRFAYGPTWQIKFLPPARKVQAPGVLCAAPGEIVFVPSRRRDVDRAWRTTNAEIDVVSVWINKRACVVRVRGDDDRGQFVVYMEPAFVRSALSGFARVTEPPARVGAGG